MMTEKSRATKIGIAILLAAALFCAAGFSLSARAEETPTLRVAFCPLDGFFEYDDNKIETGYGVDLLKMVSRYTGIHFVYVPAKNWGDTKQMLLRGEADVRMPGTRPVNPSAELDYTQHSIIDTYYAIMTKKSRTDLFYEDYAALKNLKIGISQTIINAGDLGIDDIDAKHLLFYDTYDACRAALDEGKIDALISNVMDLSDDMKQLERFSTISNYISMTKGNPYLRTINGALSTIRMEDPTFMSDLYKKWFPDRISVPFTREETDYIHSLNNISFCFQDGQGHLSRKLEDGSFEGFYPDMARQLCEKLGLRYQPAEAGAEEPGGIVVYPDFDFDYIWAESSGVDITPSYLTMNYYEITRKNSDLPSDSCQVAAIAKDPVIREDVTSHYPNAQILWFESYEDCMKAVASQTADVTFVNSYAAEYYLNMYRYSNLTSNLMDYSYKACFGVKGDKTGLLASALTKALTSIPNEKVMELVFENTSQTSSQNLLTMILYTNPIQSIVISCVAVAVFLALIGLFAFNWKITKKNEQLARATSAKQDFLSRMSHDMRTPMNGIISFSRFGLESTTLEEAHDYYGKINQSGEYLLNLINDTLDYNKLGTGNYELKLEPYLCRDFAETISNILNPRAREKGVEFTIEHISDVSGALLFDKMRLQQIFVNLLNNAIKFTPAGGHVKLEIRRKFYDGDKAEVIFKVIDDGIGMTEDFIQNKLYHPFEQENRLNLESGTGLGLSIVKSLVDAMGGNITCESGPGKGTVFTVGFCTRVARMEDSYKPERKLPLDALKGRRVLVCEDHPLNREIAVKLLGKVGLFVECAENGKVGLELFKKSPRGYYFAVLMDIRMPVMDGLQAAKAIRCARHPDAAAIPIIALSANAFPEDERISENAGMNAHLAKPIEPERLYQVLVGFLKETEE